MTTHGRRRLAARTMAVVALALGAGLTVAVIARETAPAPPLTSHRVADSLTTEVGAPSEAFCTIRRPEAPVSASACLH